MSALGQKMIAGVEKVVSALRGETDPRGMRVTPSCGCVFCDLGLRPTKMRGGRQYIHYIRKEGKRVVCPIKGIRP